MAKLMGGAAIVFADLADYSLNREFNPFKPLKMYAPRW